MKLRLSFLFVILSLTLAACNFTLASDVTPPPNYVPPTPAPTLGPLYPAQPGDVANGAVIFAQNCAPCHGNAGLGDGPQSSQLPVPVTALGLADVARNASPAQWYTVVTQGNLDRYMPPFTSLTDQQRWDVVSYTLSLHTTAEQVAQGKSLFEANCPDCAAKFADLKTMAALSEADLVHIIKNGNSDIPAFGSKLTDDEAWAVAAYLRTLTFAAPPPPTATPVPATATLVAAGSATPSTSTTPVAAESGTPSAAEMPVAGTPQTQVPTKAATGTAVSGTPAALLGTVNGTVATKSGTPLPDGLKVTLHGFDHAQDQTTGPQEVLTLDGAVQKDGSFAFGNVEMPTNRIFIADVSYQGISYQSGMGTADGKVTQLTLPVVTLYESTTDFSSIKFDQVHVAFDFGQANSVQVFEIYSFTNSSDKSIVITTDGSSIPFIKTPADAQSLGFQIGQNSAPLVSASNGFAMPPSTTPYSIIAYYNLPYDSQKTPATLSLVAPATSALFLVPEGIKLQSSQVSDTGVQQISNTNYETFTAADLKAGDTITYTLSGTPSGATSSPSSATSNQTLIFGAGALGLVLIALGVWMYVRDRNRPQETDEEAKSEDEFEDADSLMDAIIALDDLHRAGKLSDEAYRARRDELKEKLKKMS